jgi:hypothetical protein
MTKLDWDKEDNKICLGREWEWILLKKPFSQNITKSQNEVISYLIFNNEGSVWRAQSFINVVQFYILQHN